jgi:hypothetical protein
MAYHLILVPQKEAGTPGKKSEEDAMARPLDTSSSSR